MHILIGLAARILLLAPEEARLDLVLLLERVAAVEGDVSPDQRNAIATPRRPMLPS